MLRTSTRYVALAALLAAASTAVAQTRPTWLSLHDSESGASSEVLWTPSGARLIVGARAAGEQTEIYFRTENRGFLGLGGSDWTSTLPVVFDGLTVEVASLPDGRLVLMATEREPTCGTLCDEPGVLEDMRRAPVYRTCIVISWNGSQPTVGESWATVNQSESPPSWVGRITSGG